MPPKSHGRSGQGPWLRCQQALGPGGDPKTNRRPPTRLQRNRPTHYRDEAEYLADIVSIIDHGQIIASGTPDQLIDTHGGKKTLIIRDAGEEGLKQLPSGLPKAELRNAGDIAIPLNNGELTNILMSLGQTPLHDKEIEVRRPTLDDVFLNLTGRRVSEEGN